VRFERSSGVLLHPTSLPGPFGIGDFGKEARRFVDFLAAAGQAFWQIMPLGPPGYGGSPYASTSAFAGNVNLISPEELVAVGLLDEADVEDPPDFPAELTDQGKVIAYKRGLLEKAFHHFKGRVQGDRELLRDYESGLGLAASWLDDYALRLREVDEDLRELALSLESQRLRQTDFEVVLREEVSAFAARSGIEVDIDVTGSFANLTASQRFAIGAVVREALANVREHGRASHARLRVQELSK